jgi:hypothetical protein
MPALRRQSLTISLAGCDAVAVPHDNGEMGRNLNDPAHPREKPTNDRRFFKSALERRFAYKPAPELR